MSRLDLSDTLDAVVSKLGEDNALAIQIIMHLMSNAPHLDPVLGDMAELAPCMWLDELEIYGTDIVTLFGLCEQHLGKMHAVLRGYQLGIVTKGAIHEWIRLPKVAFVNHEKIVRLVSEQLDAERKGM